MIAPPSILEEKIPSFQDLENQGFVLKKGQKISLVQLLKSLTVFGYQKSRQVEKPGDFAHRGNIIDLYPLISTEPVRLELDGNTIARMLNIKTKKPTGPLKILPLTFKKSSKSILSWLHPKTKIIIDEFLTTKIGKDLKNRQLIFATLPPCNQNCKIFHFTYPPIFHNNIPEFQKSILALLKQGYQVFISTKRKNFKTPAPTTRLPFALPNGFQNQKRKVIVLTDSEIFGLPRRKRRQPRFQIDYEFIAGLKPGMYVVHIDHGVGRFIGMVERQIANVVREYYLLRYARGDKLFLPIDQADKITRYVGKSNPVVHRLHGGVWHQIKKRVQRDAKRMAQELLTLEAHRQIQKGFVFAADTAAQEKLENSFLYTETLDQEKAIQEVKKDMESLKPMDRLICGDVGFGKTEVAIRAAFKAVESHKQVCLLAPTTVLVQQHYDTFKKRLKAFSVQIRSLSRFQSKTKQKEIIRDLKGGKINIVIGTHRLLSRDVGFKALGLIIIDEEQRFGVRHKEKLKALRANVDILTLTATPIPRTLHFSLSGLRDISAIHSPPPGRLPVKTSVRPYQLPLIEKAIKRELERKGQIYYLYNKVETILAKAKKIKELLPGSRVEVAHGQLFEKDLAQVMQEFDQGKIDILVATTIIENGLDLPNVNTLIVDEAPNFGLSQLHQIRGRIGRGTRQAFAYFLYHRKKLPPPAEKRLSALLEMQQLGAGFKIALRDLEFRGAGNILGREQSGNINSVGLNLYTQLLKQAIQELKTQKPPLPLLEVSIDLPLDARLPRSLIPSERKRLALYHELSSLNSLTEINRLQKKLKQRFQRLPREVKNLLTILHLKILARQARIRTINTRTVIGLGGLPQKRIILEFATQGNWERIEALIAKHPQWILGEHNLKIDFKKLGSPWPQALKNALKILGNKKTPSRGSIKQ